MSCLCRVERLGVYIGVLKDIRLFRICLLQILSGRVIYVTGVIYVYRSKAALKNITLLRSVKTMKKVSQIVRRLSCIFN